MMEESPKYGLLPPEYSDIVLEIFDRMPKTPMQLMIERMREPDFDYYLEGLEI